MISFDDVSFAYGDRPILEAARMGLEPGGFYFLTGPSGAGKTTVMRLAALELAPAAGEIRLFDTAAGALDRDAVAAMRQRMGFVHQECRFIDHLSVARNIALPLDIAGRDRAAHEGDIADLLRWTGLTEQAEALPPTLSGGERQRAALARAVVLGPELLLADEPTGNIDREMSAKLMRLLVELNQLGRTVLIASHDLELIRLVKAQVATRVIRLSGRRLERAEVDL